MKKSQEKQKIHPRTRKPIVCPRMNRPSVRGFASYANVGNNHKKNDTKCLHRKLHFIGIGGIGVSALAKYYLAEGFLASGSDLVESEITDALKKEGANIIIGPHKASNIPPDTNLVIYSAAVENNNPELKEARRHKIKCQSYAQALGELTKKYFTIAVSGTHGKSTTTAMAALILIEAGLDPTVIVGTKLREFDNSNFKMGHSKYLVIEADEYDASFLNYWPKIIVLTNIEEDHLDYYHDIGHIVKTFGKYVGHLGKDGILVANGDDKNISKLKTQSSKQKLKTQNYNLKFKIENLKLRIPGQHNLMNAYAAIAVARALKIQDKVSVKALNKFRGTWRRLEYKGMVNGAKIFDDYAHHPTEIKATLRAAKELLAVSRKPLAKIWCVFQPHQYQRTYKLFNQFIDAFGSADKIVLLPIYSVAGRERESVKKKVSSKKLAFCLRAQKKQEVVYSDSFDKAKMHLKKNLKKGDIVLIMGAGDINKLTKKLLA